MVISAAHSAGVNAISAKWLVDGRAVVVSGGDDQSLLLSPLHIPFHQSPEPQPANPWMSSSGGGSAACRASKERPSSRAPSVRVENAHSSALRAVWTDGSVIFSCGLDQKLRCWSISVRPCKASQDGCCVSSSSSSSTCCCSSNPTIPDMGAGSWARQCSMRSFHVVESGSVTLQVLEASCLAVAAAPHLTAAAEDEQYLIAVGGRGLQLLTWEVTSPKKAVQE